ncbi:MAG: sulfotransferase family protein [Planctomycetota bacterium]|jgi:hypothetical protein
MKIFGVGWAKTGTSTLRECFKVLGYTHKGYSVNLFGDLERALRIAHRFDTFQDLPWYLYYKDLDKRFPGSKFILTNRSSDRWLRSYRNMLAKQDPSRRNAMNETRRKIYGLPFPDVKDEQLIERYERHNLEVIGYFAEREGDLLVVNWENGDGWAQLCAFLGRPVPSHPFPHENRGNYN